MIINNRLEAWLAFMCMDEPDDILSIIEKYSDFKEMYEQIYVICRDLDEVMGMFSKELQELDRNSVELMVDEMQKDLDVEAAVRSGKLTAINRWLEEKIWKYGCMKDPVALFESVCGPFRPEEYVAYLEKKFTEIYEL